jgi:hypothetical protein
VAWDLLNEIFQKHFGGKWQRYNRGTHVESGILSRSGLPYSELEIFGVLINGDVWDVNFLVDGYANRV